jgi:putative hydrolase of the HAD superfamily
MDEKSIEEIIEIDTNSWKNINTETEALMKELKAAGYLLGILSNVPYEFLAWAKKNSPVFSLPHIGLYSCEVNLVKPEEAIYRKLLSMLVVEADELVFFDDKEENIAGAKALGIEAILWKNIKEARHELLSLGVKL